MRSVHCGNAAVGPFHSSSSTLRKSGASVRSVASVLKRSASSRLSPSTSGGNDSIGPWRLRSRAALLARLPAIGFDELLPVDGAFYVYASVARFTNDALDFASRMLNEAGVAATPGPDFDHSRGHRYMRFSFAGTEADIAEGIERLAKWLR